jgi:hypothetical protein
MKVSLRVLVVLGSFFVAYFATLYATSFTGAPLAGGGKEGTPLTEIAVFTVFPLTLIVVLVIGNLLINRYFRAQSSK